MTRGRYIIVSGIAVFAAFFVFGLITPAESKEQSIGLDLSAAAIQGRNASAIASLGQQTNSGAEFKIDGRTNAFTYISATNGSLPLINKPIKKDATAVAGETMNEYGKYFGLRNTATDLHFLKNEKDSLGMEHVRYNQTYNGIPIFGAQTIVHVKKDLGVASVNGHTIPDLAINTTPLISAAMASHYATVNWLHQSLPLNPEVVSADLYIFNRGLIEHSADTGNYLVWKVELFKQFPKAREYYFIDAHNGQLVYQISGIQQAISRRIYDCSLYALLGCRLDYTYLAYTYGRSEGQAARGTNPVYLNTDTDDLYTILNNTHNYFNTTFSRNGANNLGGLGDGVGSPTSRTDGYVYLDAVIPDQGCPNAYFDGYSVNFCYGLASTDVVAHEYTHGVDAYTADLIYSDESGALNESYSDIFGEAVEYYAEGSSDWLLGEDISVPGMTGPLRSMSNPASLGYPDRFYSSNYYCGSSDGGGVHTNSSVPNHAAYLMAMGGTFNGCTITAIGRAKEEAIWYRALTTYLTPSSGFNSAYTALNSSCADLYGATSADCVNLKKALQSVEMDQEGACSAVARVTPACSAATVNSVTASNVDGYYNAGSTINITVNFGNATTGSGTVTFDSGGTCAISASSATSATCTYTILAGENSADLNVAGISGSFANSYGETVASLTPIVNLATSHNIIVDTTPPTGTLSINSASAITTSTAVTLSTYASDANHVPYMRFSNDNLTWSNWEAPAWTKSWTLTSYRGLKTVYVQYYDSASNITTVSATINYLKPSFILTAPGAGTEPLIKAFGYTGKLRTVPKNLFAFAKTYKEGIHIAACDVDGDLIDEIVTSYGPKQEPWVKVFRQNGQLVTKFLAYAKGVKGGVYLACGDLDGNGIDEIVTGVPEKYSPQVRIFNGLTGKVAVSKGFFAFATNTKYGLRLATGDLNADGLDEIIVGSGNGATTQVKVFNASGKQLFNKGINVYGTKDRTGINVAAGDVNGDGLDEIITGSGKGRVGEVLIFTSTGKALKKFSPFGSSYKLGLKVSAGDLNADGIDEIVCSKESGSDTAVSVFTMNGKKLGSFFPYDKKIKGGVETAVGYLDI